MAAVVMKQSLNRPQNDVATGRKRPKAGVMPRWPSQQWFALWQYCGVHENDDAVQNTDE